MITIFATPKNFEGEFKIIQENALSNWRTLSNQIEIFIMGDSIGAKEAAIRNNAKYIKDIPVTTHGTPTIPGLFQTAERFCHNNLLCYLNADMILPPNFMQIVKSLVKIKNKFLAVGHRWDIDIDYKINFKSEKKLEKFWTDARINSIRHPCTGIDYFVFKKGTFKCIPELVVGRPGWDNWLLWKTRHMRIPLIDLSENIFALHQNHSFKFAGYKNQANRDQSTESLKNKKIINKNTLNLLDANYQLVNGKIEKKRTREFINRNLGKLPIIFPEFSLPLKIYKKLYRKYLL